MVWDHSFTDFDHIVFPVYLVTVLYYISPQHDKALLMTTTKYTYMYKYNFRIVVRGLPRQKTSIINWHVNYVYLIAQAIYGGLRQNIPRTPKHYHSLFTFPWRPQIIYTVVIFQQLLLEYLDKNSKKQFLSQTGWWCITMCSRYT